MKYFLNSIVLSIIFVSLNGAEVDKQGNIKNQEFPYIQPVSVEEAPVIVENKMITDADSDNDGILDQNDKCPNSKDGVKVDKDGCLVVDDRDKDGITNKDDMCPNTPQGIFVDQNGCEIDSDDDGITDSKDKCPNTSKDFVVDGYGCPQTATLTVTFPPNKYTVSNTLIEQLKVFAKFLQDNKTYDVLIYGYTDNIGDEKTNKILSQKRAEAVKEALRRYGIKETRLTAIGKGEADPIADNSTPEGRAKNRRIEVELIH